MRTARAGAVIFVPARELPLWHAAPGTSTRYLKPAQWKKHFGITIEQLDQFTDAVAVALEGRR